MYTLVVCDAEPVAIEGVRTVLESAPGLILGAAETSIDQALALVLKLAPCVFLLDKSFGIHVVMDSLKKLASSSAGTAVVVWGNPVTEPEAVRFLQCGARGVIRKTAPVELFTQCLAAVCAGKTWVEPGVLLAPGRPPRLARNTLTSRELQVAELVERGMKNREIAKCLGIRTGTVKIHLRHIFEKTGIRGRYGVALSGLQAKGLLALPSLGAR